MPYSVDEGLVADLDVEHAGSQHVTSVVRLDLQLVVHLGGTTQTNSEAKLYFPKG